MKLFEKYKIKNLEIKNRLVMPPMCTYQVFEKDGKAYSFHEGHYISRAIGQVGLIIVESTGVMENGRISDFDLGLYNDDQIEPLKKIVDGVHEQGSKCALQLNHAGRKSETTNTKHIGPSKLEFNDLPPNYEEATKEEINEIIQAFKQSAIRADKAGFDALEIHSAHGYLIHQFISPLSNKREDEYGKDRFLLLKNIIKEVKSVWPKEKPIWMRISATDYHQDGINVDDWIEFLNENKDLVDIVHVSAGGAIDVPIKAFPGYMLSLSKKIKENTDYNTIGVGLINTSELVSYALEDEYCDLVAVGRGLLRNPNFLLDIAKERNKEEFIPEVYKRAF